MDWLSELALVGVMFAFIILTISLVLTLLQIKRTLIQAEQFFFRLNMDIPKMLNNLHETSENVRVMTHQTKDGVKHAVALMHAAGEIGTTVKHVHTAVREQGIRLLNSFDVVKAGIVAAFQYKKQRSSVRQRSFMTESKYIPQSEGKLNQTLVKH